MGAHRNQRGPPRLRGSGRGALERGGVGEDGGADGRGGAGAAAQRAPVQGREGRTEGNRSHFQCGFV